MAVMYHSGKVLITPYSSGRSFGDLDVEELRRMPLTLTEEEKASLHAKYFDLPRIRLLPEHIAAFDSGPIPPKDCYMPNLAGKRMLHKGADRWENGYGIMEGNIGFAAIRIPQPGITEEQIQYYNETFAREGDLFYKNWFPGAHLLHYTNGAVEDFGWGLMNMQFSPADFDLSIAGIADTEVPGKDPDCIWIFGAGARCVSVENPQKQQYASMVGYLRETPEGRELRLRYWEGLKFCADGNILYEEDRSRDDILMRIRLRMKHCMTEYMNEQRLIRMYWEEAHP